jgi:hypothetical protein
LIYLRHILLKMKILRNDALEDVRISDESFLILSEADIEARDVSNLVSGQYTKDSLFLELGNDSTLVSWFDFI